MGTKSLETGIKLMVQTPKRASMYRDGTRMGQYSVFSVPRLKAVICICVVVVAEETPLPALLLSGRPSAAPYCTAQPSDVTWSREDVGHMTAGWLGVLVKCCPAEKYQAEIWSERPRYFAAAITMHYRWRVSGGDTSVGGGGHVSNGMKQRSRCSWNHWS